MSFAWPDQLIVTRNVPLKPYVTLAAGGPAERFCRLRTTDELAEAARIAQSEGLMVTLLGSGSNVLPADEGVGGIVLLNQARKIELQPDGQVLADCGCSFQELFLKATQAGLGGLAFAVGIPGTLGGALVSNAGAYRQNIADFVEEVEIVEGGKRRWEPAAWMNFAYRNSRLRENPGEQVVLLRARLRLPLTDSRETYRIAKENQRQRISKQPAPASAGSFFKNVVDKELALRIEGLTPGMRESGVIPSGFLIEAVGMKGHRHGGAMLSARHANFMLNVGNATATEIFELAQLAKATVQRRFGVMLEEEVLYLGRWTSLPA
ncbi:MAG: UDP-N-acetylmuramate dehydrogenase [Armatimonadetes bacterium]|nr:UDP-N-acetylmuramate dehydrogenase [Armatimonadota bacterium]